MSPSHWQKSAHRKVKASISLSIYKGLAALPFFANKSTITCWGEIWSRSKAHSLHPGDSVYSPALIHTGAHSFGELGTLPLPFGETGIFALPVGEWLVVMVDVVRWSRGGGSSGMLGGGEIAKIAAPSPMSPRTGGESASMRASPPPSLEVFDPPPFFSPRLAGGDFPEWVVSQGPLPEGPDPPRRSGVGKLGGPPPLGPGHPSLPPLPAWDCIQFWNCWLNGHSAWEWKAFTPAARHGWQNGETPPLPPPPPLAPPLPELPFHWLF